ncbi:hypothetical protein [Microbacterium sp. ZW T5_56]|uniref:hypothetical protein n=1 Tax=Microbacterium sp. ZW T5_56 TaxID=3378081 RepID=UPI0038521A67
MSEGNPLVAAPQDNTSAFAGAFLLQDAEDIANAISSGDWGAGALAVASTALDTAGAIIDPIGTLIANGLGWVLDHIEPLKSWFNDFTGDAAEVASFSGTWANTGGYLAQLADGYHGLLPQLDGMAGETIDAYLAHANTVIAHLRGASDWSSAMATGLQIASTLVQMVHDIVRDVISQLVGSAISAAATTAATIGFGAPAAMAQFGVKVSALVAKVGRIIPKVLDALAELQRLLRKLGPAIESAIQKITQLAHRGPSTPRLPDVPTPRLPDVPTPPGHPPNAPTPHHPDTGATQRPPDDDAPPGDAGNHPAGDPPQDPEMDPPGAGASTREKGAYGEYISDQHFQDLNYERIDVPKDVNAPGIDAIYQTPDGKYVIVEAKYSTNGNPSLGHTQDGVQMSDSWLRGDRSDFNRVLEAVGGDRELANDILAALKGGNVDKVLSIVRPDGTITTRPLT